MKNIIPAAVAALAENFGAFALRYLSVTKEYSPARNNDAPERSVNNPGWGRTKWTGRCGGIAICTAVRVLSRASRIISLMFVLVLSISPPALAACEFSPKGDIRVIAMPEPVNHATNFSLDQIASLARAAGAASNSTPLGFYVGRFRDETSVTLEAGPEITCTRHIRIEVDMHLVDRRIEIGQDLRQRPCLFSAALEHYEKKAKADEAVFAQYVAVTSVTLGTTQLPAVAVPPDEPLDATSRMQIEQWVKTVADEILKTFQSARVAAQQAVDTPEEMKRLADACTKHT